MSVPIPVTVLTGFLGAGKTTLLNRLLKRPEMAGAAVLINEFGEVGLDHLLVEKLDEEVVLLNAGCLCCTIRGDLVRALADLAARGRPVSRVVVETTGLADPTPILQTLMGEPRILARHALDGVVTVVDAALGMATLDAQEEALRQAAVADRIVLSKTDIAEPAEVAALRERLAALNPSAPVIEAVMGEAEPAALLAAGPFDPSAKHADVARWLGEHAHDHHHGHDPNRHDRGVHAFALRHDRPLPWDGVATWLEMLAMTQGERLLRMKAILDLEGDERPVVLHAVRHMFHPPLRLGAWPAGEPRASKLVFVVKDIPREAIERGLEAFVEGARRGVA